MCGFAGFFGGDVFRDAARARALLENMGASIRHRGPDHSAIWQDPDAGIGFVHNRLAIVELSPAGNQPMASPGGRYMIVYNGELYNNPELRRELDAAGHRPAWRGHSDTETLLAAIEAWGVEGALSRTIGMFAFALWDRKERALVLGRDRLGEKPLHYGWQGTGARRAFLFGSELKPLTLHPAFAGEIDRAALTAFMRFSYVPAPGSIYRGIAKLPPGCIAVLRPGADQPEVSPYWSASRAVADGLADPVDLAPDAAVDALEALLKDAIGRQMMADVPLGAFLSGGIDSSTIVALMQAQSSRPVRTFSIGFHEEGYDEAVHARAVAAHLGTDHTELYVTADEAMAVIPRLPAIYDEPFADASQIPTFLVSRLARRDVTVSLSGDAGDDLFAGYNRYGLTDRLWRRMSAVPRPVRRLAAGAMTGVSPQRWNRIAGMAGAVIPAIGRWPNPGHKIHKGAGVLASATSADLYRGMVSHWNDPERLVIGGAERAGAQWAGQEPPAGLGDVERMMATDLVTYLPDDILAKVDRAAMAVSLETRVPFLDHRVVEFAWRLPLSLKLRDGKTKWALRQLLYRHVPPALVERPKMGFGLPIDTWLRGPLRDWAEALLDPRRLRDEGFLEPGPIRTLWDAHQSGKVDVQYHLWDVLMFQSWLEQGSGVIASADRDVEQLRSVDERSDIASVN